MPARREERIPVRLEDWSRFMRETEELAGAVVNIGARGVLLESTQPFELGAKLGLTFFLPGDPVEVRVVGQVSRQAGRRPGTCPAAGSSSSSTGAMPESASPTSWRRRPLPVRGRPRPRPSPCP